MLIPWFRLASDATLLAMMEAQTVIGLRLGQIVMGRGSVAENQLMVAEKMLALARGSYHDGDGWVGASGRGTLPQEGAS